MDKPSRKKDDVAQRIKETTQETERLKQELQNLIAAGITGNKSYDISASRTNIPLESTNKVQIIRSYDPKHSQHVKKPVEATAKSTDSANAKNEAQALSPKKPKTYDVQQAREYIKKQRDKRKEESKGKKIETKITAEIRKEKLQELQQKAKELVKKNVERQRSKSRNREPSNESIMVGFNCAEKTKKHFVEPIINKLEPHKLFRDPNLLYPPEPANLRNKHLAAAEPCTDLNNPVISQKKQSKSLQNLLPPPEPHYMSQKRPSDSTSHKSTKNLFKTKAPSEHEIIVTSNVTLRSADVLPPPVVDKVDSKDATSKSISHKLSETSLKQQSLNKEKTAQSSITLRSRGEAQNLAGDLEGTKDVPSSPVLYQSLKKCLKKELADKKNSVVPSIITLGYLDNSPYQTEDQKDKIVTPEWLKDTAVQGDPYNFINTVKRQLKYIVSETKPFYVDVGVQGNLTDDISKPKSEDNSKKSDLKSFISHKFLNLDPQIIVGIDVGRRRKFEDGPTITDHSVGSNNDSDTSKNIPSISSESGTSLRRNAEFVVNVPPNLDTKKVDEMKLKKSTDSKLNTQKTSSKTSTLTVPLQEDVERIKKQLFTDTDCYTPDFVSTDLSKSRNSLLSFNCAKRSPNRVPESYGTWLENLNTSPVKSNSSSETGDVSKRSSKTSEKDPQEHGRKSRSLSSGSENGSQKRKLKSLEFMSLVSELDPSATDPQLESQDHNKVYMKGCEGSSSELIMATTEPTEGNFNGVTEVVKPIKNLHIPCGPSKSRNSLLSLNCAKRSPNRVPERYGTCSEIIKTSPLTSISSSETGAVPTRSSKTSKASSSVLTPEKNKEESNGVTEVVKPMKGLRRDSLNRPQFFSPNEVSEKIKSISSLQSSAKSVSELHKSRSEQIIQNKIDTGISSKSESNIYGNKEYLQELPLKEPKLSLNIGDKNRNSVDKSTREALIKNISVRSGNRENNMNNTNEIHLKFEAEIHLLNDFNQSLKHFSEIEKAFESLRSKNDSEMMTKKELQNRDTQTSIITKTSTRTLSKLSDRSSSQISTINYSRGSGIDSEIHTDAEETVEFTKRSETKINGKKSNFELSKGSEAKSEVLLDLTNRSELNDLLNSVTFEDSLLDNISGRTSSVMELSRIDDVTARSGGFRDENLVVKNVAGVSLRMFDQLIKDEDARIEILKKIVKIREQALLDRTRGELVWLEMQKKQLLETGKMPEASVIKKKQRGILLRHQQEKHEMQNLKQMQKEASAKRKTLLKKEKNLIKNQLLSDNMLSKLKTSSSREKNERRLSGPLKVIQATGSIHSETSLSKGVGGTDQEIKSITSRSCSVNVFSATSDNLNSEFEPLELTLTRSKNMSAGAISNMKKKLLMLEHALAKRRKAAEELLQWHKKLLEEEKAIKDLESKVEKIISKIPSESNEEPSKQLKDLSKSISERTSSEQTTLSMSHLVLDRLLPSKDKISVRSKSVSSEVSKNIPQEENLSEDSNRIVSSAHYSADFDVDSVPEVLPQNSDDQRSVSSISQLIEDFSKIEDNILNLSLVPKKQSLESEETDVSSAKTEDDRTEEIVQDEERSQASSLSSQIASKIEIKKLKEPSKEQQGPVKENDKSVIIIEEPSEHFTTENEVKNQVILVEIKEKENEKQKTEENTEMHEKSIWIGQNDSENVPQMSSVIEELSSKEQSSEVTSVSEELRIIKVPDNSNKSSLAEDVDSGKQISFGDKMSDENEFEVTDEQIKDSEEANTENGSLSNGLNQIQLEQNEPKETEDSHSENELDIVSIEILEDASVKIPENIEKIGQDIDVVRVDSENTSTDEESRNSAEESRLVSSEEDNVPSSSHRSLDQELQKSAEIRSGQELISLSKDNASVSHQYEEVEDSNVHSPSTSSQMEEQATTSQILSRTYVIEENEHHSLSTIVDNEMQRPNVADEERQSSENKTDEEKVASLSIRASASQLGQSINRTSPLDSGEPSTSEVKSVTTSRSSLPFSEPGTGSVVSAVEKSGGERLSETSFNEEKLNVSDGKDGETSVEDLSKISGSSKIGSVKETFSGTSLIEEKSLSSEGTSKVSINKQDESEPSSSRASQNTSEALASNKTMLHEGKESAASLTEDLSVSEAKSSSVDEKSDESKSTKSISLEKSSKSLVSGEKSEKTDVSSHKSSSTSENSPKSSVDVKKRVQEILNEASPVSRGDKSPRMQDLCVMTYDLISPTRSPEAGSPLDEKNSTLLLGNEAEELLRKQLAIEQEIKLLTEQQQKEQVPQFYIREIPNKPPPPYTPPSKAKAPKTASIIPSSKEEIEQITEYSAKIIHKAYLSSNLDNISISDNTLNLIAKNIDKGCYKYVFDLCKEVAIEHYGQFAVEAGPSWLQLEKKHVVAPSKPLDVKGLKKLMNKKLLELFGLEKQEKRKENAILKWSRKKRDHVDEVLVQEMQAQESSWTNFDRDELIVKDRITNEIMEMLLKETAQVLKKTVQKKSSSQ